MVAPGPRTVTWAARVDTRRDVGHSSTRLELLERVLTVGDLYLQRTCSLHDRWRALWLPGPRAGLQQLRPRGVACVLLSLWRGSLVLGVERPDLFGLTVQLRLTRLGELTLREWRRLGRAR